MFIGGQVDRKTETISRIRWQAEMLASYPAFLEDIMGKTLKTNNFTEGKILVPLIKFALPVLLALFLQAMYGAIDLMVVGQFASAADVSAVSTGSQIMFTLTNLVASFAMGATILLARQIGEGETRKGGETIGACITLFALIGVVMTLLIVPGSGVLASVMQAPKEAFELTTSYIRICGTGMLVIIAYNLIGSIFRGIGDSTTPLITVAIACVFNILGDLLLIAVFNMGTAGAAIATVVAQAISVVISFLLIKRKSLPFKLERVHICFNTKIFSRITKLGLPIALQDLLVGISFLIIQAIVNSLGLLPSAGVGVAEKVCAFVMLVPSSFMQSMSAFVAQNAGAKKYDRATKALECGIAVSFCAGLIMFYISFFHGDLLASIFSNDSGVIEAAADYLKSYAIDCLLVAFLFCFLGFYNGLCLTKFVMIQGIIGAFGVRVPVSYFMSKAIPISLFRIGLATPCSTILSIIMCLIFMLYVRKRIMKS